MKKLLTLLFLFIACLANAQVGINNTTPDASAALDVTSIDKGLLPPRMTAAQRNAIPTPATGLMVFQTDSTAGIYYYNGTAWTTGILAKGTAAGNTPYWDGSKWVLGSGNLYNNGANVGIGVVPAQAFDVKGKFQVNASGNVVKLNNVTTSFPSSQGVPGSVLQNNGSGVLLWTLPFQQVWILTEEQPSGTNGGLLFSNSWNTRTFTTVSEGAGSTDLTLGESYFTLAAGIYSIEASAPAAYAGMHKIRLIEAFTNTVVATGTSEYSGSDAQTRSTLSCILALGFSTTFQLQHYVTSSTSDITGGRATSIPGTNEVYSVLTVRKLR